MRVYLPVAPRALRAARGEGQFGPAPLAGHAVTPAVVDALPDADEEEREYAALTAAAVDCVELLGDGEPPARVVVAVDTDDVAATGGGSAVTVTRPVPWRRVAALLVDSPDAAPAVLDARAAQRDGGRTDDAGRADDQRERALERLLDHELGWFGAQEVDEVLAGFESL